MIVLGATHNLPEDWQQHVVICQQARREERRAQGGVSAAPVDPGPVDENGAPVVRRTFAELSSHRTADGQRPGQSFLPVILTLPYNFSSVHAH